MSDNKEKSLKYFNSTAENYDSSMDGRYVTPMYSGLVKEIKKNKTGTLLDVGCGTGNVLKLLEDSNFDMTGIDYSENMINQAKSNLDEKVSLYISDAEKMQFEDKSFDIIVCNASFHHYPHPLETLKEMRRVAKDNAKLYIGEGYIYQPFRFLMDIYFKFSDAGDYKSYGKRELKKLFLKSGFELTKIIELEKMKNLYVAKAIL